MAYFSDHESDLDEDSKRRLQSNPLRILDSKNPQMQGLIDSAPALADSLDNESSEHFAELQEILDQCDLTYRVNQRLVRGLDYYSHTVFEWITDSLGAQGTVCAGGRYDGLVEQLGGRQGYAAGYAMGCERLIAMMVDQQRVEQIQGCDVYLVNRGDNSAAAAYRLSEKLRDVLPGLGIVVNAGSGSIKSQMKKADRSGAPIALILAESEMENDQVSVKFLRETRDQQQVSQQELPDLIRQWLQ